MRALNRANRRMSSNYNDIPIGILAIQKLTQNVCPRWRIRKELTYKISILGLTYVAYTCYHLSRKPISVVKAVLHGNCSLPNDTTHCGYAPFDGPNSSKLFGLLDLSFLFTYATAMFVSGFVAERVSLRYFLAFGMLLSGFFTYLFGYARTVEIHSIWYFVMAQAMNGIFQTTGWPGVVTLVGRWFGKSKRGLIFGIWNSHTSIGNILGTLIAARYVETDWALSFIVPGIIIGVAGFLMFLFLVESPEIVGIHSQQEHHERRPSNDSDVEDSVVTASNYDAEVTHRPTERTPILNRTSSSSNSINHRPIGLIDALYIPGVLEFAMCLFFTKLVSYTFMFWLPLYIESSSNFGPALSAGISTLFDVGGIIGAIAAGFVSDYTGMPAVVCSVMLFIASPLLLIYEQYGAMSITVSVMLLVLVGIFVNGPYALITTSVSAELGQHSSLEGNAKALATVTAIIDGTGSIGAAIGPLLAGVISSHSWQDVFYMLIISDVLALLLLVRLVLMECTQRRRLVRVRIE